MGTIAANLLSLNTTKAKLKQNLLYSGIDSSAENNFDDLVDMAFDEEIAWQPDPAWLAVQDLRTWTPEGGIGLIISNHGYGLTSFIVGTAGAAQYTVVVNDGTSDISTTNYASGAQADISVTPGDGTTYYAVKITSAAAIIRFQVTRSAGIAQTNQQMPILWFYGNLTSLTSCLEMFYKATVRCHILQAVHIADTALVTNMSSMFITCASLRSVPAVMDTARVTNMSYMFSGCASLRSVPAISSYAVVTDMTAFGAAMRALELAQLDVSAATTLTKLQLTEASGLKGLIVSSSAPWTGTPAPHIEITNCGLDSTALIALFNSLGTIAGKTIKVTGNPGVADLSAGDLAIATNKGWTVTTT